jgi:hypothetical protein
LVLEGRARMTRSHALLHCPNATLAAARVEAWEGIRAVGVLLSNRRREDRLLRFLKLSRVGRFVEGGLTKRKLLKCESVKCIDSIQI